MWASASSGIGPALDQAHSFLSLTTLSWPRPTGTGTRGFLSYAALGACEALRYGPLHSSGGKRPRWPGRERVATPALFLKSWKSTA